MKRVFHSLVLTGMLFALTAPCTAAEGNGQPAQESPTTRQPAQAGQQKKKDQYTVFTPTKKVDADTAVAFPADI